MNRHLQDAELAVMKLRRLVAKTLPKKPRVAGIRGCLCKLNIQVTTKSPAKQHRPR